MLKKIIYISLLIVLIQNLPLHSTYKEGDTLRFWSVSYVDWIKGELPKQKEMSAICRKVGTHCYFFQDFEAENNAPQTVIDDWVAKFDTSYYKLTEIYGPVPDALDNDPRVFILSIKNEWWGGYFDPTHQMPDTMVQRIWKIRSSEREIIYVSSKYITPSSPSIMAHEFGHLLHWGCDHSPEPANNPTQYWEDTWVDEGFSTFAEILLTENINLSDIVFQRPFFSDSTTISLINFTNYSASRLWMLYLYEHFGGLPFIQALANNQLNGIAGEQSTLIQKGFNISFNEVYENWVLANYIDDPGLENGLYYYRHYNFPKRFHKFSHSNYSGSNSSSLPPYSAHYISIDSQPWPWLKIDLSGLPETDFKVDFLLLDTISGKVNKIIKLNASDYFQGYKIIYDESINFNRIIMVVMNIKDNGTKSYNYALSQAELSVTDLPTIDSVKLFYNTKNEQLEVNFNNSNLSENAIYIFDSLGNILLKQFVTSDNCKLDISCLSSGIYLVKANKLIRKFVKI